MSALAANPNNPVVFFDVTIGGQVRGARDGERPELGVSECCGGEGARGAGLWGQEGDGGARGSLGPSGTAPGDRSRACRDGDQCG